MKLILIFVLGGVAIAADPREAQVMAADSAFDKCWQTRDTVCLGNLVTDDFVQVVRTGGVRDKASFLEGMKAGRYSQRPAGEPRELPADWKIRFFGNTAIFTGSSPTKSLSTADKPVTGYFTYVWVAADGKTWRLASMHASLTFIRPGK